MGILLFSDAETLSANVPQHLDDGLAVLLTVGERALASLLTPVIEDLLVVDVTGPRLSRLNFDAIRLASVDLTPEQLTSSGGRRLVDVLGRLAEESLTLAFYGSAVGLTGSLLQDGRTAGLNLVPRCVVIPNVLAVPDLNSLLASLSNADVRILALDEPVGAHYDLEDDSITAEGEGSVLLAAFRRENGAEPTARLQLLSDGMKRNWPA